MFGPFDSLSGRACAKNVESPLLLGWLERLDGTGMYIFDADTLAGFSGYLADFPTQARDGFWVLVFASEFSGHCLLGGEKSFVDGVMAVTCSLEC